MKIGKIIKIHILPKPIKIDWPVRKSEPIKKPEKVKVNG